MQKILLLAPLFVLLAWHNPTMAQQYHYHHLTTNEGLPSSTVYSIIQDSKGFMWMTTDAGVCRYDGFKFQTWTVKEGLPDNDILFVKEDIQGRIWFLPYKKDLSYFYRDSIHRFNPDTFFQNSLVISIEQQKDSTIWFSSTSNGILRYKNGKCTTFTRKDLLPDNYNHLALDGNDNVWAGSINSVYPIANPDSSISLPKKYFVTNAGIVRMLFNRHNEKFVYNSAYLLKLSGDSFTTIFNNHVNNNAVIIVNIRLDHDGNFLIATSKGAYRVSRLAPFKVEAFLPSYSINNFIEDREQNLWFTTLNNGVFFLSKNAKKVENYGSEDNGGTQLTATIGDSTNNNLFFSSYNGDFYQLKNDKLTLVYNEFKSIFRGLGHSVKDSHDIIWCGNGSGIFGFPKGDPYTERNNTNLENDFNNSDLIGKTLKVSVQDYSIFIGGIKSLAIDKSDILWLSSYVGVLKVKLFGSKMGYGEAKLYTNDRSSAICCDTNNVVWFATLRGLNLIRNDTVKPVTGKGKAIDATIKDIKVDRHNILWIATSGKGLYAYRDSILQQVTSSDGLSSDIVNSISVYNGYLLLATKNGIDKVVVDSNGHIMDVFPLQVNDGLISMDVAEVYKAKGKVYAATDKGLSVFDETEMQEDTTTPLVYLTSLKVNERDTSLQKSYVLPYNRNSLRMEYVGLLYKSNRDLLYRYRMDGLDSAWQETRFMNIQYSTLPPGTYTFMVDARSLQGRWSGHPAMASFTINPPFWQTWWFRTLMGLLFLGIVTAISYAIIRYYRNRNEVARRLVQLEGQALRAQMNPHFIFNSLNAIHDFIADQDQRSAHLYLSRFAALIRRILELSRKPQVNLAEEIELLKLYIDLENMRFENKFDYELKVDTEDDPADIFLPSMLIQPYVENAIRHGLMNKNEKGHLKLEVNQKRNNLVCRITDNGIGRKAATELGGRNLKKHRSFAMDITQERVETMNDKGQKSKADIAIIDLVDTDGNAIGTTVELTIPLNH